MLTFYTNPMSRGRIVRWMLEEVGQPYDTVVLDYGAPMKAAGYRAINPMGKVPTLVHDGKAVTEVAAICLYLADTFPKARLMAADRAAMYRWMFFAAGPLEQAVINGSLGWQATEETQRRLGYGTMDLVVNALTTHLSQTPYVAGDAFSAADVYLGSQIGWGLRSNTLPGNDTLTAYWARLATRPALARANALDDALVKGA